MIRILLKIARSVVQSIMGQVTQQVNIVQDQVANEINRMVQQTMDGIWIGKGADAFVEEMTSQVMPKLNQVVNHGNSINTNINRAMDIITQAENKATSLIGDFGDMISGIF
ncbi:MAG: WXG100 family type VII secretion target [Anaerolineaceae bacterium]|nr:WXG100 family type VII secretion target [Anaerolineaceae bacterium]